jgi:predicted amidohydrolase
MWTRTLIREGFVISTMNEHATETPASPGSIAACQFEPEVGAPRTNYDRIEELVAGLDDGVELAVFPELCVTGYDLDAATELADAVPGALTDRAVGIADRHDLHLVVGVPEREGSTLYNDLVLVDGDGVRATYRKQYLWGEESAVFAAGEGPVTAETPVGTLGLLVCYDLNLPEAALAYARSECDVLAVSAAWRTSYLDDWKLLLRARALDGTCYVVGSNHAGDQRGRSHAGGSRVVGPGGTVLDAADGDAFAVSATDRDQLETVREQNPVFETRRRRSDGG